MSASEDAKPRSGGVVLRLPSRRRTLTIGAALATALVAHAYLGAVEERDIAYIAPTGFAPKVVGMTAPELGGLYRVREGQVGALPVCRYQIDPARDIETTRAMRTRYRNVIGEALPLGALLSRAGIDLGAAVAPSVLDLETRDRRLRSVSGYRVDPSCAGDVGRAIAAGDKICVLSSVSEDVATGAPIAALMALNCVLSCPGGICPETVPAFDDRRSPAATRVKLRLDAIRAERPTPAAPPTG